MSGFEQGEYVADRDGAVWLVVHDGGMATRATAVGAVSIGIVALEEQFGPLMRVHVPRPEPARPRSAPPMPPRTWARDAEPSPEQLTRWLRLMDEEQLATWVEQIQPALSRGMDCFVRDHERRVAELSGLVDSLTGRLDQALNRPASRVDDGALLAELGERLAARSAPRAHGARPVGT